MSKAASGFDQSHPLAGTAYDCVVWHDGQDWVAVIDTAQDGDLTKKTPMADFHKRRQYASFSEADQMSYSFNMYQDGNVLEIVVTAGSHGTHVAGIVGANFPDRPEMNGVAPGCQIISIKIGDSRLGSMETGPGLLRALLHCARRKVDLINMSYGEPASRPSTGAFVNLARELVEKHNIIFVSSAGNAGPALTTVGAPGGTVPGLIGVAATVTQSMMTADYSMRAKVSDGQFTWSSRGPAADGSLGVCINACGGAIAPIPAWCLAQQQLMNGTSMSSPNACGGLACVLSGLKQAGASYNPISVRRALERTATKVGYLDRFSSGYGHINVPGTFESVVKQQHLPAEQLEIQAYLPDPDRSSEQLRGLYLRDAASHNRVHDVTLHVGPRFPPAPAHSGPAADAKEALAAAGKLNEAKLSLHLRLALKCDQPWVQLPTHLLLLSEARTFAVRVDPRGLAPGVHLAEITGVDAERSDREGSLFSFPITVVVPQPPQTGNREEAEGKEALIPGARYEFSDLSYTSGHLKRFFFVVPAGAAWADVTVRGKNIDTARTMWVHTLYMLPQHSTRNTEDHKIFQLESGGVEVHSFAVVPSTVLEVCLAQNWSSLGSASIDLSVDFHGAYPAPTTLSLHGTQGVVPVQLSSSLRSTPLKPTATLSALRQSVAPSAPGVVSPVPSSDLRDTLLDGRPLYQLRLSYGWEAKSDASVTVRAPLLNGQLYESLYHAQMWMLFDANRMLLGSGDAWPSGVQVSKGKLRLSLQVRHEDPAVLERLKNMPVYFQTPLSKPVTLPVFATQQDATTNGGKFSEKKTLPLGQTASLWVSAPSDALPEPTQPGDVLIGEISYERSKAGQIGSGKRPGGWQLTYHVPQTSKMDAPEPAPFRRAQTESTSLVPASSPPPGAEAKQDGKAAAAAATAPATGAESSDAFSSAGSGASLKVIPSSSESEEAEIRDAHIAYIKGIKDAVKQKRAARALLPALLSAFPAHLPLLALNVKLADESKPRDVDAVVRAADQLVDKVDRTQLSSLLGLQLRADHPRMAERKEADSTREMLLQALAAKATALADKVKAEMSPLRLDEDAAAPAPALATAASLPLLVSCLDELSLWYEPAKAKEVHGKYQRASLVKHKAKGELGLALQIVNGLLATEPSQELLEERIALYEQLGWGELVRLERNMLVCRYPPNFVLH